MKLNYLSKKVVIGLPVYNGEKYLEEALNSLVNQTYSNIEILISDNASTDRTKEICSKYVEADNRVKHQRQPSTVSALENFEYILSKADGDFFMWAACDDLWEENWIASMVEGITNSNADAAYGRLMHIDESSKPIDHVANCRMFEYKGPRVVRRLKYFIEPERLGKANPIYSLFKLNKIKNLKVSKFSVDFHIVYSILENSILISVPQSKLYKRIHGDCDGNNVNKKSCYLSVLLKKIIEPCQNPFTMGYFKHSNFDEKTLLLLALPIKLILEYIFQLRYLVFLISKNISIK